MSQLLILNTCQVFQFSTMTNLVQSISRVLMWVIGRKVNERVQWGWNTASAVLQRSIEIILIAIPTRLSLKCQNNFWDLHCCLTPTICLCMRNPKVPFVRLLTLNSPKVVAKLSTEERTNQILLYLFLRKSIGNICRRQQFQRPAQPSIQWNDRAAEMKFQIQTFLFPHILKGTTDLRVECFCQSKVRPRPNNASLSPFRQVEKMLF